MMRSWRHQSSHTILMNSLWHTDISAFLKNRIGLLAHNITNPVSSSITLLLNYNTEPKEGKKRQYNGHPTFKPVFKMGQHFDLYSSGRKLVENHRDNNYARGGGGS